MSQPQIRCKIDHDRFCFVCAQYIFKKNNAASIEGGSFPQNYQFRFGIDVKERNLQWSPSVCCPTCRIWINNQKKKNQFSAPTQWNSPQNHPHDCFYCNVQIPAGFNQHVTLILPDVSSVVKAKSTNEDESVSVCE